MDKDPNVAQNTLVENSLAYGEVQTPNSSLVNEGPNTFPLQTSAFESQSSEKQPCTFKVTGKKNNDPVAISDGHLESQLARPVPVSPAFLTHLFWSEQKDTRENKKRTKEAFPFAVSSEKWREHDEKKKKQQKKEEEESARTKRKEEGEKKKNEREK